MKKKELIFIILIFFSIQVVYSQSSEKYYTDGFGIYAELSDCNVKQISGNLHYQALQNSGVHFFYTYSYYNQKNSFAGTVSCGINILRETITIPASAYNLDFDFWDTRYKYIPNLSLSFSYSRLFFIRKDKLFFSSFSAGVISAVGINQTNTFSTTKVDSLIIANENYNYIPTPVINIELGRKKELKNGNYLNLSLYSQLSFSEKYTIEHNFFINEPKFTSNAQIVTKLMFIGIKFSYEIRQNK